MENFPGAGVQEFFDSVPGKSGERRVCIHDFIVPDNDDSRRGTLGHLLVFKIIFFCSPLCTFPLVNINHRAADKVIIDPAPREIDPERFLVFRSEERLEIRDILARSQMFEKPPLHFRGEEKIRKADLQEILRRIPEHPLDLGVCKPDCKTVLIEYDNPEKRSLKDAPVPHFARVRLLDRVGDCTGNTDEEDRLTRGNDKPPGVGKDIDVGKNFVDNRAGTEEPDSFPGIEIGRVQDGEIKELAVDRLHVAGQGKGGDEDTGERERADNPETDKIGMSEEPPRACKIPLHIVKLLPAG